LPATVRVEPGLRVHHVPAGPLAHLPKEALPGVVDEFTEGVLARMKTGTAGWHADHDENGPDAIHANYWLSGMAGHVLKHELGLPLVSTFHTLDRVRAEASPEDVGAAEPARRAEAEARVIGCSDAVLASCSVEADQISELYGGEPSRIEIVPPGVDHAFFSPGHRPQARRALGLPEDGPVLLFVGRIQPLKGARVAVEALARLEARRGAVLVVVGGPSGPRGEGELAGLHSLVDELGLGASVRFVPPQRHEMLSTYYRSADVCLVPSRSESFGLVALEAAACGTPVVASAVGGLRTLVDHGRTGFLVEGGDPSRFADYVADLLADRRVATELAVNAAARARVYTWSGAASRLRNLYTELTDRQLVDCL
ncbi:MAG TPA: glycosyltransferase, partial [Acidimicrobiales bacterium]